VQIEIRAALDKFRNGDQESAFIDLIEMAGEVLPALTEHFRIEADVTVRALLVRVVWERRDQAALPFLAEALVQPQEEIWQEALDGLVAFASPESLDVLRRARQREDADEEVARRFRMWLEEAIQQVEFELRR
jgi:hypothetical protein